MVFGMCVWKRSESNSHDKVNELNRNHCAGVYVGGSDDIVSIGYGKTTIDDASRKEGITVQGIYRLCKGTT